MSKWIPASSAPDKGISVIVWGVLEGENSLAAHEAFWSGKAWTSIRSDLDGFDGLRWMRMSLVTHWQPMPEKP